MLLWMEFEWDDEKAAENLRKHGVAFQDAVRVFSDPYCKILFDVDHSEYEDRYNAIGKVHEILFVVYTERKECTRIISAREATSREKRWYYDNQIQL